MTTGEIEAFIDDVLDRVPAAGARRRSLRGEVEGLISRVSESLSEKGVEEIRLVDETLSRIGTVDQVAARLRDRLTLDSLRARRLAGGISCLVLSLSLLAWAFLRWREIAQLPAAVRVALTVTGKVPALGVALGLLLRARWAGLLGAISAAWLAIFWFARGWGLPGIGIESIVVAILSTVSLAIEISILRIRR